MNSKGQLFQTIIKMSLGLVLFVIAWFMITDYTGGFRDSANACKDHGGMCKTPCSGAGEAIWFPGNPSCEIEGGVCCTSDEITRLTQQNELPMYDDGITINVSYVDTLLGEASPIRENFRNGQSVPLFVGGAYNFDVKINRNAFRNEEFGCEITIKDDQHRTPTLQDSRGERVIASYTDNECFQESEGAILKINDNPGQLNFRSVKFDGDQKDNAYALEVKIYNGAVGSDLVVKASFPLSVQLPVSVKGLDGEWSKSKNLTISCNGISCDAFSVRSPEANTETGVFSCEQGKFRTVAYTSFVSDELEVPLHQGSFDFGGDQRIIDQHVCFMAILENGEQISWTPREKLKMDFEPPVTKGIERNKAICEDKDGSGCKKVHYIVYVDYTMEDFEKEKLRGLEQQFKETLSGFLSNKLAAFLYREEGGICPSKGSREYSESNDFLLNMKGAIVGNVCIYSEDNVENKEDPQMKVYYDLDIVERPTIEGISDDIIERLTGLPRPSSRQ